jgi:heme/copper-type cytochrome/quinol oxidase subunit 2
VPLAPVMLAAVITNLLAFHITMWPTTLIPMPLIVTVLWFIVAWRYRAKLNRCCTGMKPTGAIELAVQAVPQK